MAGQHQPCGGEEMHDMVRLVILLTSLYTRLLSLGFSTQKMAGNRKLKLEERELTVKSR